MNRIKDELLKKLGDPGLIDKITKLSLSDYNSLLLEISKTQTSGMSAADLMKKYETNRFVKPSEIDPALYHGYEAGLLSAAKEHGFQGVLLSPVSPLGNCSIFGCVDQNNVISASRGTEVLSDPANMLAVIIADGIKKGIIDNKEPVHYCTTHRVTRGQAFSGKISFPHFGIFCIVSSGRDSGSYGCERSMLTQQLRFYKYLFESKYHADISLVLRKRGGYKDPEGFFRRMSEHMKEELPDVPISTDESDIDNAYYKGVNFKLYVHKGDEVLKVGDGGFVDWMQKLAGNRKGRCLISGLGIDRLILL